MRLGLVFTRGVSLESWVETGIFYREKSIYEKHLENKNFSKILWFTYGSNDIKIGNKLKEDNFLHSDVEIVEMPELFKGKFGILLYSILLPLIKSKKFKQVDCLKTNQVDGAWSALLAKKLFKKRFILRCGYVKSLFCPEASLKRKLWSIVESVLCRGSDRILVASQQDKEYLIRQYKISYGDITILRNYVDTESFRDLKQTRKNRFLFVGRLSEQKNIFNILKAIKATGYGIDIYGDGELREQLEIFIDEHDVDAQLKGVVANSDLVSIYNSYKYYILASHYEGLPKTLLEAMACACICLGTDVVGINELLKDNNSGILSSSTSADDIAKAISRLEDNGRVSEMILNSRNKIVNYYSLNEIVNQENEIVKAYEIN